MEAAFHERSLTGPVLRHRDLRPPEIAQGAPQSSFPGPEAKLGRHARNPRAPTGRRRRRCGPGEPSREPEPAETVDRDAYVEIRSPTSREKISILAVIDRCRAYQESDEYKRRSQSAESQDGSKTVSSSADRVRTAGDRSETSAAGQHNSVRNLREKFQKLNS